jgi:hypothetical protein
VKRSSHVDLCRLTEDRQFIKVAVVGGQATGKTFVVDEIRRQFGKEVCCVPETVRQMREQIGYDPASQTDMERIRRFQFNVYRAKVAFEGVAEIHAEAAEMPIVLCDRTIFDGVAYLKIEDFREAITEFEGLSGISCDLWHSFYDVVIFLEMPTRDVFENRRPGKSHDLAVWRSDVLEQIWVNHPNFIRVKDDIPGGKLASVKAYIADLLREEEDERLNSIAQ